MIIKFVQSNTKYQSSDNYRFISIRWLSKKELMGCSDITKTFYLEVQE